MINGVISMAPQIKQIKIKTKFWKWELQTYSFRKRWKLNKDLPQVYSVKRTCGRWTVHGKIFGSHRKTNRKFIQWRRLAGENLKLCRRRHGVSPYSSHHWHYWCLSLLARSRLSFTWIQWGEHHIVFYNAKICGSCHTFLDYAHNTLFRLSRLIITV